MIHMYTYNITQNKIKELSTQYYTIMRRIYVGTFPSEFGNSKKNWHNILQPVPWKMRLEKLKEMQIEILNGGEILVNCRFKCNKNLNLNLYRKIPRNSNPIKISIRLCTVRYWEIWLSWFWLVDQNLLTIQDMDLHFFHRFESHLPGNGLYLPLAIIGHGFLDVKVLSFLMLILRKRLQERWLFLEILLLISTCRIVANNWIDIPHYIRTHTCIPRW